MTDKNSVKLPQILQPLRNLPQIKISHQHNNSTKIILDNIPFRPQLIRHTTLQGVCQGCCIFLNLNEINNDWCLKCRLSDTQKFREMDNH